MTTPGAVSRRRVTADIAVQLVGRLLNLLLGGVVIVVLVRTLGDHRYGQWATLFAVSDLLGYLGAMGLDSCTVRNVSKEPERESEWLGALVSLRFFLSVPVTLAFLAITLALSSNGAMRISAVVLSLLLLIPTLGCLTVVFQLRVRNDLSMVTLTLNSLLWTGSALLISVLSGGMVAMAVAFVGAALITLGAQLVLVHRMTKIHIRASRPLWGDLARFALPLGVAGMLTLAYGKIDQVLVFKIAGADSAGLYGAMYRLLDVSAFVPVAVMTTLFPVLAAAELPRMRQLVQLATEYLAMASFPLFAFILVAAEPIVRLLFGEEFVRGADALRVLMAAFLVICFGYVGGWMTVVLKLQKQFIRFALIALVFNVALNLILIPKYGYMAAAWLTLGTELLVQSLTLGLVFRRLELRPRFSRFARTALAAAAMGGLVFAVKSAGGSLAWMVITAGAIYPLLLLTLGVLTPAQIAALLHREAL